MKKVGIIFAILAVVVVAVPLLTPQPSDKIQIQNALKEAIKAGKEGRPGSALELLSRNFSVNSETYGTGRNVAKFIKDAKPDIELASTEPLINGDTATIEGPATVSLSIPKMSAELASIKLEFQKEDSKRWLIFPAHDWKLVNVMVPEDVVNQVASQFSGF